MGIVGIWKYIVVPHWRDVSSPALELVAQKLHTKEKLILLALLALAGYLSWQVLLALIQLSMSY